MHKTRQNARHVQGTCRALWCDGARCGLIRGPSLATPPPDGIEATVDLYHPRPHVG